MKLSPELKSSIRKHGSRVGLIAIGGAIVFVALFMLQVMGSRNAAVYQLQQASGAYQQLQQQAQQIMATRQQLVDKDNVPLYGPNDVQFFLAHQNQAPELGFLSLVQYSFNNDIAPGKPAKAPKVMHISVGIDGWGPNTKDAKVPDKANGVLVAVQTPDGNWWHVRDWAPGVSAAVAGDRPTPAVTAAKPSAVKTVQKKK